MRFVLRILLLGSPLLIFVATILWCDPFKVLYKYDFGNYYDDQPYELNRDYVSTEMLLRRVKEDQPDAFIFGSSRSFPYHCNNWQQYIPGARCFHYPAASENLYGVYSKIKLIDRLGLKLRHVLLIADYHAFDLENRKDHLHILHPRETGDGWFDYEGAFLKASFSSLFIVKYLDYRFSGEVHSYARDIFQIKPGAIGIVPGVNDYYFAAEDRQLRSDEDGFYQNRQALFRAVDNGTRSSEAAVVIAEPQSECLKQIKEIFDKHQTDYRIIISPLYDQVSLNRADLARLREIFGADRILDYSGKNDITTNMHNYYDPDHYRPFVAEAVLRAAWFKN